MQIKVIRTDIIKELHYRNKCEELEFDGYDTKEWEDEVNIDEKDILEYFNLPITEDTKKVIEELYLMDFLGELFEDKDFQEYIDEKYPIDED